MGEEEELGKRRREQEVEQEQEEEEEEILYMARIVILNIFSVARHPVGIK